MNSISPFNGGLTLWDKDENSECKPTGFINILDRRYGPNPLPSTLSLDERFETIKSIAAECIQEDELYKLLIEKANPICYDGFEPSGRMHLFQGLGKAHIVDKLTKAGCVFVFWIADWFALINNKMNGDIDKIRTVGLYFIEIWKSLNMNMRNVRFLWAKDEIGRNALDYWTRVVDIARNNTLPRIKRCCPIMGRSEDDELSAGQIIYPCMQCCDIFYLKADICQLGVDQRRVNVLAREYTDSSNSSLKKPIILSHAMMPSLIEGQEKMSKSKSESAIFMDDTEQEVNQKIKRAFCPKAELTNNPCSHIVEHIVFPAMGKFTVQRKDENGGSKVYNTVKEFQVDYTSGNLHPMDLKVNLSLAINQLLLPVRKHFEKNPHAISLLKKVRSFNNNVKT